MNEAKKQSVEIFKQLHSKLNYWNNGTVFLQTETSTGCKIFFPTQDKEDDKLQKEKNSWQALVTLVENKI